jgi:GNAT superfamily N-acetyltransferase
MQRIYYYLSKSHEKPELIDTLESMYTRNEGTSDKITKTLDSIRAIESKIPDDICREVVSLKTTKKYMSQYATLFIEDESGVIVGLVIFEIDTNKKDIEIQILCTKSGSKAGNGKLLVQLVKDIAKSMQIPKIKLIPVMVKHDNPAIVFYEREGFSKQGIYFVYNVLNTEETGTTTRLLKQMSHSRSRSRSKSKTPSPQKRKTRSRRSKLDESG